MKILVTGATGFIGNALLHRLVTEPEYQVTGSTRQQSPEPSVASLIQVGTANAATDWSAALQGVDVVIHVAAHLATRGSSLEELRRTNVDGTLTLARQALSAGTQRFIFISSVGVNGSTTHHAPFNEISLPAPTDDYARSKLEAEQALQKLLHGTAMDLVIIRPPLVYAGHAPRNFAKLMQWVRSGIPMPFAAIHNRRSMIALENLVDFIALCIKHPAAANELFLVSDGTDLSTAQMVTHLASGIGTTARLVPVPESLLRRGAKLLGRGPMYSTLCASLVVDSDKARRLLGWTPPLATIDALIKSGRDYRLLNA
ncbi:NAD-dependent epimerase/dehydratase family protein [Pseudomonas folii]|uniref:NAD-dependent epimerase/dehydratase family protein n=1 Tax=Pseudomonas folii TaxID=2762593 RepID=A0ABR7B577_9PSED|nr:NAD-dependent epimerase/dehydratase family protein [Pseudomonas folii]MBC3952347.1 NAD-dependent epimerase/dehydratase family protein [Pseudomonas folii]